MSRAGWLAALWITVSGGRALADAAPHALDPDAHAPDAAPPIPAPVPVARPVIAIDDTRSHGPTTRNWLDVAATPALLFGRAGSIFQLSLQLAAGLPKASARELRELYGSYHLSDYQLRVRNEVFWGGDTANGGPMTLAIQRYFPVAPLALAPLLYAHFGLEAALSTPWLSGRFVTPHPTIQILDGVDTELASDGWSIRPASAYFRGDFLACRSVSGELGFEPEAFGSMMGANEYGTRFHVSAGWSLGCRGNMSPYAPKLAFEYRGRVAMYAAGQPPSYRDSIGVAVQLDLAWCALQLFYRSDLGSAMAHHGAVGLRLQVGRERAGE